MRVNDAVCQLENNFVPAVDFENNRRRVLLPEVESESVCLSIGLESYLGNGYRIFHFFCFTAENVSK